jgi:hypothetical protein
MTFTFTFLLCLLLSVLLFIIFLFVRLFIAHDRPGTNLLSILQFEIDDVTSKLRACEIKPCQINYEILKNEIVSAIKNELQSIRNEIDKCAGTIDSNTKIGGFLNWR